MNILTMKVLRAAHNWDAALKSVAESNPKKPIYTALYNSTGMENLRTAVKDAESATFCEFCGAGKGEFHEPLCDNSRV